MALAVCFPPSWFPSQLMAPSPQDFIFDNPSPLYLISYILSGSLESVSNFLNKSAFLHFHHHYLGPSPPMRIKEPRR